MDEGLEPSPLNVGHLIKLVSFAMTIASKDGTDSALTATQNALLKKAGETMVSSADTLNMEEELDTLGTGLRQATVEDLIDAKMMVILKDVRCI